LNKSSEKATFSFIFNGLSWFDWTQHKKHQFSSTIELTIAKAADFITFHIFDTVWMGCVTIEFSDALWQVI